MFVYFSNKKHKDDWIKAFKKVPGLKIINETDPTRQTIINPNDIRIGVSLFCVPIEEFRLSAQII